MITVTMSGKIESGVIEVASAVSQMLSVPVLDEELTTLTAQRCGVPVSTIRRRDERPRGLKERLLDLLNTLLEKSAARTGALAIDAGAVETQQRPVFESEKLTDTAYKNAISAVVKDIAMQGDVVIVGRGSQIILKDFPTALHVQCVAPKGLRCSRFSERDGVTLETATKMVSANDRDRLAFHRMHWGVDMDDPMLYDLTIDTGRLDSESAAKLVSVAALIKCSSV